MSSLNPHWPQQVGVRHTFHMYGSIRDCTRVEGGQLHVLCTMHVYYPLCMSTMHNPCLLCTRGQLQHLACILFMSPLARVTWDLRLPIHSTLTPCPLSRATPDDLICQTRRRTLYIPEFPLQWRDSGVLDQSSVNFFSEMVWCFVFLNHFGFVLADLKSGLWRLAWLAQRVRGDLPLPSPLTLYTLLHSSNWNLTCTNNSTNTYSSLTLYTLLYSSNIYFYGCLYLLWHSSTPT